MWPLIITVLYIGIIGIHSHRVKHFYIGPLLIHPVCPSDSSLLDTSLLVQPFKYMRTISHVSIKTTKTYAFLKTTPRKALFLSFKYSRSKYLITLIIRILLIWLLSDQVYAIAGHVGTHGNNTSEEFFLISSLSDFVFVSHGCFIPWSSITHLAFRE